MPETLIAQNNFTAGELSPRLFGRSDLVKYRNGLAKQENFLTQKHGGIIRRSGSRFVAETKDSIAGTDRVARLIEFQFSNQQTYILEFGELYVRFYRDKGQLRHGTIHTVSGATHAAGVATITLAAHSLSVGDVVSVQGILTDDAAFKTGYDGTFTITAVTATTLDYDLAVAPPGTYASGGTIVETTGTIATEIATPYTAAQVSLLKWAQSADVLYIAHSKHEPRLLKRSAGADSDPAIWSLVELNPQNGPYLAVNSVDAATIDTPVGAEGDTGELIALSDTGVAEVNSGLGFVSTDVGRLISWEDPAGTLRWATITTVTDRQNIIVTLGTASLLTTGIIDWQLGAWSDTDGWPFCVSFHDDRLWWGGSPLLPQTIWGSEIGNFTGYAPRTLGPSPAITVTAENAITLTINDDRVNTIHWLQSDDRGLILLTSGGIFVMEAVGDAGITPVTPPRTKRQITEPSSQIAQPHRINGVTIMVASGDRKVLEFIFQFTVDRFIAPDLTILSEHITLGGIVDTALQIEPDNVLWAVRDDGVLLAMTYERAEQVVAWSRHLLGGTLDGEPNVRVESVAVIRDGVDDLAWLIVKRTIGSVTRRYVEFLDPLFGDSLATEDGFFVDAGLTLDAPIASLITGATKADPVVITAVAHGLLNGTRIRIRDVKGMTEINDVSRLITRGTVDTFQLTTLKGVGIDGSDFAAYVSGGRIYREVQQVTGLNHLALETVKILADGGAHADKTVTAGGAVTLDRFASLVHIGLGNKPVIKTLPLIPDTAGERRGRPMRVDHVTVRWNRTLGGKIGDLELDQFVSRLPSDPMGAPPPLDSGRRRLSVSARHEIDVSLTIEGSDTHPMNILSLEIEAGVEGI